MWQLIGSVASYAIPAVLSYLGQRDTNKENRQIASEQMQFQERMSSTSYQRAMQDMQTAGLNPMLAYSQGGAATPAGATTRVENELSPAIASASAAATLMQQLAAVEKTEAETAQIRSMTFPLEANLAKLSADTNLSGDTANLRLGELHRLQSQLEAELTGTNAGNPKSAFEADYRRRRAEGRLAEVNAAIRELEKAGYVNENQFQESLGEASPFVRFIMQLLQLRNAAK